MSKQSWYLRSEEIYQQWLVWKNSAENVSERAIPDKLALQVKDIATRMANSSKYSGYDDYIKEDMIGDAIVKVFKNLKNLREEKKDHFFNYMTLCIQCSFYATLQKHYKHVNLVRDLTLKTLHELQDHGMLDELSQQILKQLIAKSKSKPLTREKKKKRR